ncbi:hypothetical protein DW859_15935 [Blautia obeum]|uniref:Uncharacterized protein n=1 Tax=Blautia obeum TaxID=40520 RepID=A0A454HDS5_9FIRM|nr:hypothetical protein [Blautia obeum]RGY02714.1 hypothetical protein DXA56_15720 [Blautia obeum]RHC02733.1 hypothetical protein DW859_15935 [Blautia obeum]
MRKKSKSAAILAVIMAMTLAGSSAVYAEENPSAKTTETDDNEKEDTRAAENEPAPCNEGEHELIESKVVLPTCTERGYTIYKCKADGCTYEEKRDETAALGHELKEVSMQEATADKPGVITYKCQRQGCDYTELAEIPVKNTNTVDGKTDDADTKTDETPGTDADSKSEDGKTDASEEDKNSNTENASVDKDSTSGKTDPADSDTSADSKNEDAEEDLPDEDIDEEYASFASSTSTDIVTEYDPETAVGTICVAKKDSDDPTETEEVTGMTVPTETTEIRKDSEGNITDLAISTSINEIKNGFSLTSENKKLHSIAIIDEKDPENHWITLRAKETVSELGIHIYNGNNKIIITLTENEKPLNIIKVSDTEKEVILTTSTNGTCVINKVVQNISVDKDWKYSDKKTLGRKNQIILNNIKGSAPYLKLEYVKDETVTTSVSAKDENAAGVLENGNTKVGNSESKGSAAEKQKDPDEELYWIQPYGEENQEPIVITVYKK